MAESRREMWESLPRAMIVDMQKLKRITIDPAIMGGKPCIRGMRVTVGMIVEAISAGREAP